LSAGRIDGLSPADGVEREVTFAESRFDLALGERAAPHTFIEVKNVTLGPAPGE
ncbi:MAG TPA: DNA/RNA nuclease SfsA, partial [Alcanivorax sp.]|nr:DNA/RNA nuclease SfsA [Alcanivorax sp.]